MSLGSEIENQFLCRPPCRVGVGMASRVDVTFQPCHQRYAKHQVNLHLEISLSSDSVLLV